MATITYKNSSGTWTFFAPTVTVTQVPIITPSINRRIGNTLIYTVRSYVYANNATELANQRTLAYSILTKPEGTFTWTDGGTIIAQESPATDRKRGPRCSGIDWSKFHNVHCAELTWQLETQRAVSQADEEWPWPYDISYTIATALDKNYYTVRTLAGVLTVHADKLPNKAEFMGADCYRACIDNYICAVPRCWQRVQRNFQQSEDGLSLAFTFTDEQRMAALPPDCTDGDVTLQADYSINNGLLHTYSATGFYEAPLDKPDAPQYAFAEFMSNLWKRESAAQGVIMQNLHLGRSIYRNRLDFSVSWDVFIDAKAYTKGTGQIGDDSLESISRRSSNFLLALMTQADEWINEYKEKDVALRDSYGNLPGENSGTSKIMGWCGAGKAVAPSYVPQPGLPGNLQYYNPVDGEGREVHTAPQAERYSYWHHRFTYDIDCGKLVIPSKVSTEPDIIQQVTAPQIYLLITGEARSIYGPVVIPDPYTGEGSIVLKAQFSTDAPISANIFTASWRYIIKLAHRELSEINVPYTPLVDEGARDSWLQPVPELVAKENSA